MKLDEPNDQAFPFFLHFANAQLNKIILRIGWQGSPLTVYDIFFDPALTIMISDRLVWVAAFYHLRFPFLIGIVIVSSLSFVLIIVAYLSSCFFGCLPCVHYCMMRFFLEMCCSLSWKNMKIMLFLGHSTISIHCCPVLFHRGRTSSFHIMLLFLVLWNGVWLLWLVHGKWSRVVACQRISLSRCWHMFPIVSWKHSEAWRRAGILSSRIGSWCFKAIFKVWLLFCLGFSSLPFTLSSEINLFSFSIISILPWFMLSLYKTAKRLNMMNVVDIAWSLCSLINLQHPLVFHNRYIENRPGKDQAWTYNVTKLVFSEKKYDIMLHELNSSWTQSNKSIRKRYKVIFNILLH